MASLNFTDIADIGSKDRDSGSFLVLRRWSHAD